MKLASLRHGRDGRLIVVSRNLETAVAVPGIAHTLQQALDDWQAAEPQLQEVYQRLNAGTAEGAFPLLLEQLAAPLPRAYQYLDGASYLSHISRNRQARGESLPGDIAERPLVYQGISHGFLAWNDDIRLPSEDHGIDFEGEIAAVTDAIPLGASADEAAAAIRLFVLLNDVSLRALIPAELRRTFGFLTGKPASSLGPIAVTPDELGELWDGRLVWGRMRCQVGERVVGDLETGIDTPFHYGDLIAHVAQTRAMEPGTLVGLGTISNEDESAGCACLGELRALETIRQGEASTPLLRSHSGDGLRAAKPGFTAVVAANDLIALGALAWLKQHRIAVPGDVSLIGHNDMPLLDQIDPPLTSVRIQHYEMGFRSARLLLDTLRQVPGSQEATILLRPQLILRKSTAAPPPRKRQEPK